MNALPTTAPRIDVADPASLSAWADRFEVPRDELRTVVMLVGDDVEAVELVLKGSVTAGHAH